MVITVLLLAGCLTSYDEYLRMRMALLDQDGDGYIWDRFPEEGGDDCDDRNQLIHPGTDEVPYNNKDDDCNASTPDDDVDKDGFPVEVDCNDNDDEIYPGATDAPSDSVDQNCDGYDNNVWSQSHNSQTDSFVWDIPGADGLLAKSTGADGIDSAEVTIYGDISTSAENEEEKAVVQVWEVAGEAIVGELPLGSADVTWSGSSATYEIKIDNPPQKEVRVYAFSGHTYGYSEQFNIADVDGHYRADVDLFGYSNKDDFEMQFQIYDSTGLMEEGADYRVFMLPSEDFEEEWPSPDSIQYLATISKQWNGDPTSLTHDFRHDVFYLGYTEVRFYFASSVMIEGEPYNVVGKTVPYICGPGISIEGGSLILTDVVRWSAP